MHRGRSMTVSSTRTRSVSFSARLALVLTFHPARPTLDTLPTEVLLDILQLATAVPPRHSVNPTTNRLGSLADDLDDNANVFNNTITKLDYHTLRALALTSRVLSGLAHSILYGRIALSDLRRTYLFSRTVLDCAHRDITLVSTTSPISPTSPVSATFACIPALYAGKFTTRIALEYPFIESPRARKIRVPDLERFHTATGALLGVGSSAPSIASPVLASLRTFIVDTSILEYHLKNTPFSDSIVSPTPSELILRTYIPWTPTSPSPLSPLAAHCTHLTIACPSPKWSLPSATLAALGGAPSLTHLVLVRRANANEDNDAEFVRDVAGILSSRAGVIGLTRVVLVVLPDSTYKSWKHGHHHKSESPDATGLSLSPELLSLQTYLSSSYIWIQLMALARSHPSVCVVPGFGDPWTRALRKNRRLGSVFESNIFHDDDCNLWNWAVSFKNSTTAS